MKFEDIIKKVKEPIKKHGEHITSVHFFDKTKCEQEVWKLVDDLSNGKSVVFYMSSSEKMPSISNKEFHYIITYGDVLEAMYPKLQERFNEYTLVKPIFEALCLVWKIE